MSIAVRLGEDKKCLAAVVGLDFGASIIYGMAVFIKSVLKRRFVVNIYTRPCKKRTFDRKS